VEPSRAADRDPRGGDPERWAAISRFSSAAIGAPSSSKSRTWPCGYAGFLVPRQRRQVRHRLREPHRAHDRADEEPNPRDVFAEIYDEVDAVTLAGMPDRRDADAMAEF